MNRLDNEYRLKVFEDLLRLGYIYILPIQTENRCDNCKLCGDFGECTVTGYPPQPEDCASFLSEGSSRIFDMIATMSMMADSEDGNDY